MTEQIKFHVVLLDVLSKLRELDRRSHDECWVSWEALRAMGGDGEEPYVRRLRVKALEYAATAKMIHQFQRDDVRDLTGAPIPRPAGRFVSEFGVCITGGGLHFLEAAEAVAQQHGAEPGKPVEWIKWALTAVSFAAAIIKIAEFCKESLRDS